MGGTESTDITEQNGTEREGIFERNVTVGLLSSTHAHLAWVELKMQAQQAEKNRTEQDF